MHNTRFHDRSFQTIIAVSTIIAGIIIGAYIGFNGLSRPLLILVLGIPFLIITIYKPWIAIFIFFVLIPLENLYVLEGTFTSTATKLMGAYLLFLLITSGSLKYIGEVFKNKKTLWILGFGTVAFISITFSRDTSQSLKSVITLWLSIISYFVLIMFIRNIKTLNLATLALVTGAVLSVLSPIVLGFGSITSGTIWERYGGLWGDQNEFAAILLLIIPIAISLIFISKKRAYKITYAFFAVILLIGFMLTYSRGGVIAFFALSIFSMLKLIRGENRVKILALVVPLVIFIFLVFYFTFADEFITRMETLRVLESQESVRTESSLSKRYYYYFELSPKLFFEHPILGVGFRDFISHNIYKQISHNTYLEVLTGTGLLGFIPFIMILFLTWKELRKIEKIVPKDENQRYMKLYSNALELGFLSYLVAGLFISLDIDKMTWLSITLSAILLNIMRLRYLDANQSKNNRYNPFYSGS